MFCQHDCQQSVFCTVIREDVGERRCNDGAESEISERPDRMFAGRSATEILGRYQDAGTAIARLVQEEIGNFLSGRLATPIVKKKLAKASPLDSLEELLGNDLIGINVGAIKRCDQSSVGSKWLHI